jgi:hypothetical protein
MEKTGKTPKPRFDLEKFRALLSSGWQKDAAAKASGIQPQSLATLLRRKGWKLVKTYSLAPIDTTEETK